MQNVLKIITGKAISFTEYTTNNGKNNNKTFIKNLLRTCKNA